jgi:hypothetical protein
VTRLRPLVRKTGDFISSVASELAESLVISSFLGKSHCLSTFLRRSVGIKRVKVDASCSGKNELHRPMVVVHFKLNWCLFRIPTALPTYFPELRMVPLRAGCSSFLPARVAIYPSITELASENSIFQSKCAISRPLWSALTRCPSQVPSIER